ncbi:MAG: DUF427 domain-containing protein [bacterium]
MQKKNTIPLLTEQPDILRARLSWRYNGEQRPAFAEATQSDQESVWDYPRPPVIVPCHGHLTVHAGDVLIADTHNAVRVLETAGAPTVYIPPEDTNTALLEYGELTSICEWKGVAQTITAAGISDAGWRYTQMFPAFSSLYLWPSFYPGRLTCRINGVLVQPQPGGYYGGWVTTNLTGPIKGVPGSQGW